MFLKAYNLPVQAIHKGKAELHDNVKEDSQCKILYALWRFSKEMYTFKKQDP